MVQYTEILPKTLGVRFNMTVLRLAAAPLDKLSNLLDPVIRLIHWINKPFEAKEPEENNESETLDELDALVSMAREEEQISSTQEKAIRKIPDLSELHVSDLMIPRDKMVCVNAQMTREQVLQVIQKNTHSRYPVLLNAMTKNEFIGMLEIRQMLFCENEEWQKQISPIQFIDMEKSQLHIAENMESLDSKISLVRDHTGTVIGMLTVRDLFDELFLNNQPEVQVQEQKNS